MSTSTSAARCSGGSPASAARTRSRRSAASDVASGPAGVGAPVGPAVTAPARGVLLEVVGQRVGRAHLAPAHPVQAGVDDDPVQPGGDRGVATERLGPAEGRDQRVLQRVGRVLGVAGGAQGDRPEPVPVAGEELTEGVRVAGEVRLEQGPVVAGRRGPPPGSRPDRDLGDLPAVAAVGRRQPGQPDEQVAGRRRGVQGDGGPLPGAPGRCPPCRAGRGSRAPGHAGRGGVHLEGGGLAA